MKHAQRQRGVTLLEQLIALAALAVIGTAAMMLLGATERARRESQPGADSVWTRATAANELAMCESAAADLAYFDLTSTVAAARAGGSSKGEAAIATHKSISNAAAPPPSTPPSGFCGPVVLGNPGTWPSGFDPRDNATWSSVEWWSSANPGDPSTWYYRCAPPGGGGRLTPVYSYGDGVEFAGGDLGESVSVVGPAAVVPQSGRIFHDQVGDAIVFVRTEASMPKLSLGSTFDSSSGTIRLVAGDSTTFDAIQQLVAGDVLVATGTSPLGAVRTAVVELRSAPLPIRWPSPLDSVGQPILRYFEAAVLPPGETYRWGLRNAFSSIHGVTIEHDASVAVVDRTCGVSVFYTTSTESGSNLIKVVNDEPADALSTDGETRRRETRQILVRGAAAALRAEVRTMLIGGTDSGRAVACGLTIAMPISGEKDEGVVEPLAMTVKFLASALTNSKLGLTYVTISESVSFPLPGVDGSGLDEVDTARVEGESR